MLTVLKQPAGPVRPVFRHSNDWTLREHEVVVSYWPDKAKIRQLLPHRSVAAINNFASRCNLRKTIHHWTAGQDARLRRRLKEGARRKEIAEELGLTLTQVANRMQYMHMNSERLPPRPTGNKLMDAIRCRLFDMNMTARELDEACRSGAVFRRWSPARTVSMKHILAALKVLDGQLTIEWSHLDEEPPPAAGAAQYTRQIPWSTGQVVARWAAPVVLD